jgi:transcriptional regulator with XRE-family HTH domain
VETKQIDAAFREALNHCIRNAGYGSQKKLAKFLYVSPSYITQLLSGRSYGSEAHRRQVAEFFGYKAYDDFLKFGFSLLGEESAATEVEAVSPGLRQLFAGIKQLDQAGLEAVEALLRALNTNRNVYRATAGLRAKRRQLGQ